MAMAGKYKYNYGFENELLNLETIWSADVFIYVWLYIKRCFYIFKCWIIDTLQYFTSDFYVDTGKPFEFEQMIDT